MRILGRRCSAFQVIAIGLVAVIWSSLAICGEIHEAAKNDRLDEVKALLKENPDLVSSKDSYGWTPLHWAAREGYQDLAEFLITNNADLNAQNNEGWSPLHEAIFMGQSQIQQLLLQHGGQDLATNAITSTTTNLPVTEPILDTSIHDAARDGDLKRVKALLKEKPDRVNSEDGNGWTPMDYAVREGHEDVVKLLLAHKARVDTKAHFGWTPLHFAVSHDHYELVKLLLAHGADVNARDHVATTPLHIAALKAGKDVASLLLAHKADIGATNIMGWTALHYAASAGNKDVVALLLSHGADVNARDVNGATALIEAENQLSVWSRNAHNRDILERQLSGWHFNSDTNYISATKALIPAPGHKELVKLLLDNGADANAKNYLGATALSAAVLIHDNDAIELLRQHGAHR
jgi:serine/threonine-protein phosphatase 6 regulatory ankyrin repeat subunit B